MLHRLSTQIGQTTLDHGSVCKQVHEYLSAVHLEAVDGQPCPDWNAALIAWAAVKDGILPPVGASNAAAWMTWGTPLDRPLPSCVVVMTSGSGRHGMQVGMTARVTGQKIYVIGAFDGLVSSKVVPIEQIVAARKPPAATSPVLPIDDGGALTAIPNIVIHNALPAPATVAPQNVHAEIIPPSQSSPDMQAALSVLLKHVQAEFASVHSRIDQVANNAIARVQIESPAE